MEYKRQMKRTPSCVAFAAFEMAFLGTAVAIVLDCAGGKLDVEGGRRWRGQFNGELSDWWACA